MNAKLESDAPDKLKLLLVSNCQTLGLSRSINFFAPHVDLNAMPIKTFQNTFEKNLIDIRAYDILIGLPQLFSYLDGKIEIGNTKSIRCPSIFFNAFHPDICCLRQGKTLLKGKMGRYHSTIVFAAMRGGYPQDKIIKLFNKDTYTML